MSALVITGCASQVPRSAPLSVVADASRVDMCTILTDDELTGLGIKPNTRKRGDGLGEVGCRWTGQPITLDLERDKDPIASYRSRQRDPAFTSFADSTVNGRPGVRLSVRRDRSDCTQLIDGGPVSLVVAVAPSGLYTGPKIDSCAEALRIAQMIEPRLPTAGS
jgi:hypothetical protein